MNLHLQTHPATHLHLKKLSQNKKCKIMGGQTRKESNSSAFLFTAFTTSWTLEHNSFSRCHEIIFHGLKYSLHYLDWCDIKIKVLCCEFFHTFYGVMEVLLIIMRKFISSFMFFMQKSRSGILIKIDLWRSEMKILWVIISKKIIF